MNGNDKLKTYTSYRYESDKNTINDRYIPNNKQLSENLIKNYKSDKDNELKQFSIHIRSQTEIQSPSYASLRAITNLLLGEAQSQTETSLLEFASLSSHEVPTERSEGEARSRKMIGLPNHFNLLVCKVPKRLQGARSIR